MALTTRAGKGSALTHAEIDANFTILGMSHGDGVVEINCYRIEMSGDIDFGGQYGTWITSDHMSDCIGWNASRGTYIGSDTTGTNTWVYGNGTIYNGGNYTLWHAGNDGSGSGLDADTVDGLQASSLKAYSMVMANLFG
jgi:hypothetical protein